MSNHAMKDITPPPQMDRLDPAYGPSHDHAMQDYLKELLAEQLNKIKKQLEAMIKGHRVNWQLVQLLLNKISSIAGQLKNNEIAHQQDLNKLSRDLATLIEDIKDMEAQGKANPGHKQNPTPVMKELAEKFAKDFTQLKKDAISFTKDAVKGKMNKTWNQGKFPYKVAEIVDMISGETIMGPDGKVYSVGQLVHDKNYAMLAQCFQHVANIHAQSVANPDNSYDKQNDVFDHWLNGGDIWSKAPGIDTFNNIVLAGAISDNNSKIQRDGEIVSSDYSVGKNVTSNLTQLYQALVNNELAR